MHYNLISISETGTDKVIVYDARDVLRSYLQSPIDLALCGHKHRPWVECKNFNNSLCNKGLVNKV